MATPNPHKGDGGYTAGAKKLRPDGKPPGI